MLRTAAAAGLTLLLAAPVSATTIKYEASLAGIFEVPPNASPATGFATLTFDDVLDTLVVDESFSGLTGGNAVAAHIHCCAPAGFNAGVAIGFVGFPGSTSGLYNHTFDLTSTLVYNASYLSSHGGTAASAEAALIAAFNNGTAYLNIHDAVFPGGEIRGQVQAAVPEPATVTLIGTGIAALLARKRRRNPRH